MSIIAKLAVMLGLDSAAFDAGMNKARGGLRNFGGDAQQAAVASVNLAGSFMRIHTAARMIEQGAKFSTVLVRSFEESTLATTDLVEAIYKIPLGIGEAIKAVTDLEYEFTGEGAAVRKIAADTAAFVAQTSKMGQARKEIEAIAAIGEGARAGAAMIGLEGLDKQLAEIEAAADKKRKDVGAHAASGTMGAMGYVGPSAAKSALEDIERERAKAEAEARRQDILKKGESGWSELTKADMAYDELRLSAGDYRRLELSMLDIESSMIDEIIEREVATEKLATAQANVNAAIDAALPDYDAVLVMFDEMVAGEKALADEADALAASLRSPWQVLQAEVDKYTLMLESSLLTQEQFDEAVRRAGKGAVEAAGGSSSHVGQGAVFTERNPLRAVSGGDTVPSLLRQVILKEAEGNRHLQRLVDSGGLG